MRHNFARYIRVTTISDTKATTAVVAQLALRVSPHALVLYFRVGYPKARSAEKLRGRVEDVGLVCGSWRLLRKLIS